jgi:hypothetical protein
MRAPVLRLHWKEARAIAFELSRQANVSARRKHSIESRFVTGHDFSRAAKRIQKKPGFSPCQISSRLWSLIRSFPRLASSFPPNSHRKLFQMRLPWERSITEVLVEEEQ